MLSFKNIRWMIVLLGLALVGLIAIQIHWVRNAIDLEKKRFDSEINRVLVSVADILEKREVALNVRKKFDLSSQGKRFFMGVDSIVKRTNERKDTTSSGLVFWNEISPGELQTEFRQINKDGTLEVIEETKTDSSSQITYKKIRSAKALPDQTQSLSDTEVKIETPKSPSQQRLERFIKKSGLVSDIFKELFDLNVNSTVEERVNPRLIDSLLRAEFATSGISTPFEFGVYDLSQNRLFVDHPTNNTLPLLRSPYKIRLFPHDIFVHPDYLMLYFPEQQKFIYSNLWLMFITSAFFLLIIILAFYFTISTILRQKKVSEIKNDFINNMTHELKTPISTVMLACDALTDPDLSQSKQLTDHYIKMIRDENKRLAMLVDHVLQSALLEKSDFQLKTEMHDVHVLIEKVLRSFNIQFERRKATIFTEFLANPSVAEVDAVHFTNAIFNLIDNALKYSPKEPQITIKTFATDKEMQVSISDKGIGIQPEQQKKIFEKLYRVPTGNIHNVKGFGLGLSYVKVIIDKHKGEIEIDSEPGKGSEFVIHLPLRQLG